MDYSAALQAGSPLLLGLSRDLLSGQRGGVGASMQGLGIMLAQQAEAEKKMQALRGLQALGINVPGAQGGLGQAPQAGAMPQTPSGFMSGAQPTALGAATGGAAPAMPQSGLEAATGGAMFPPMVQRTAMVLAQSDPAAAQDFLTKYMIQAAGAKPDVGPTSVQEYRFAQDQGFQGSFQDFLQQRAAWSRAPGTSVNIRNEGTIPPGYEMVRDERGNPLRLRPIPGSPDYVAAVDSASSAVSQAGDAIAIIDKLVAEPTLKNATGWGAYAPFDIPGVNAEARALMAQAQGTAFLGAIDRLRGTGQISEIEGAKAEAAIARLQAAQSYPAYIEALNDYRAVLEAGQKRARQNLQTATGRTPSNVPPLTAAEMADEELMRTLGLE